LSPPNQNCGDGGLASNAELSRPAGLAVDSHGSLYIAAYSEDAVRKIDPNQMISTVAGNRTICTDTLPGGCGDGGPATSARLYGPESVAVDPSGDLFIADTFDNAIREVTPNGNIKTIAGTGSYHPCMTAPNCGDGGPATNAMLNAPYGVAVDSSGDVYIADTYDNEIRKVTPDGNISLVIGAAFVHQPEGLALDSAGNLYIADTGDNRVLEFSPGGSINRIAGDGAACGAPPNCGDGNAAFDAQLSGPTAVAVDATGTLYIADTNDHDVRQVR
jgi:sugar lactone lactonase YvrE